MEKSDLIARLTALNPQLKAKETELAIKVMLDAFCGNLAKGGRVEIRGFGSFALGLARQQKKSDNKYGGSSTETVKYVPQFKPAKELRERVDNNSETRTADEAKILFPVPSDLLNPIVLSHKENKVSHV